MSEKKPTPKGGAIAAAVEAKHPGGRPSIYSAALAMEICDLIAKGNSIRTICAMDGMPGMTTIITWLADPEKAEFQAQYIRAREAQADFYAAEIISIADDGSNDTYLTDNGEATNHDVIARSRLRVDARKWYASKLAPKKYGDKVTNEHTGANGESLNIAVSFVKPDAK